MVSFDIFDSIGTQKCSMLIVVHLVPFRSLGFQGNNLVVWDVGKIRKGLSYKLSQTIDPTVYGME